MSRWRFPGVRWRFSGVNFCILHTTPQIHTCPPLPFAACSTRSSCMAQCLGRTAPSACERTVRRCGAPAPTAAPLRAGTRLAAALPAHSHPCSSPSQCRTCLLQTTALGTTSLEATPRPSPKTGEAAGRHAGTKHQLWPPRLLQPPGPAGPCPRLPVRPAGLLAAAGGCTTPRCCGTTATRACGC